MKGKGEHSEMSSATGKERSVNLLQSVGGAWVVTRSKSYNGRPYYFNTLTGEALWNLSPAEIEKSKVRSHNINNAMHLDGCPEPSGPPTPTERTNIPEGAMITNPYSFESGNKFSKHPVQFPAIITAPFNQFANGFAAGPKQMEINIQPFNPNVWATQPSFLMNAGTHNVNHTQTSMNVAYGNGYQLKKFQKPRGNFNDRYSQRGFYKKTGFKRNIVQQDLRQKLAAKRSQQQQFQQEHPADICPEPEPEIVEQENVTEEIEEEPAVSHQKEPSKEETVEVDDPYQFDVDGIWLENNVQVRGTQLCLNLASLKSLINVNSGCWYIAVDKTILLNHIILLSTLLTSDSDCKLMVPREVLVDAETSVGRNVGVGVGLHGGREYERSKRALAFFNQRLDNGSAVVGEVSRSCGSGYPHIINCCLNLKAQGFPIVLVSNIPDLHTYKSAVNIPIFTVHELKHYIENNGYSPKSPDLPPVTTLPKITITNDLVTEESTQDETECDTYQRDVFSPLPPIPTPTQKNDNSNTKTTTDAEVQTDTLTPVNVVSTSCVVDDTPKAPRIHLNRVHSVQSSNNSESNVEKKKYGWRKRKATSKSQPNTPSLQSVSCATDKISKVEQSLTQTPEICESKDSSRSLISPYADKMEGSETSSNMIIHRSILDKVTIYETSTSGVISNTTTTSNVDFELDDKHASFETDKTVNEKTMYRVENEDMVEYLKTHSDEFISRYMQLMEEALSQVLLLDPDVIRTAMPPPWTLREAVQCIHMKFKNNNDVIHAAKELSDFLVKNSTDNGRLNMKLEPELFMEMYSYGVHLIEKIQVVLKNNEDLQFTLELLSKLLKDIRDFNVDTEQHNNLMSDFTQISATELTPSANSSPEKRSQGSGAQKQQQLLVSPASLKSNRSNSYNLRTRRSKVTQENTPPDDRTVVANNEMSLFNTLNLQKSRPLGNSTPCSSGSDRVKECPQIINENTKCSDQSSSEHKHVVPKSTITDCETKVLAIEKQSECGVMASRNSAQAVEASGPASTFDDGYYEPIDNEFCIGNENNYSDESDFTNDNIGGLGRFYSDRGSLPVSGSEVIRKTSLNVIFKNLITEIKDAFIEVHRFCENTFKELSVPTSLHIRKIDIYKKAESAYTCLVNICKSLDSILGRDVLYYKSSIEKEIEKLGVNDIHFDVDSQYGVYRELVTKCMDQANILLESVKLIISVVKTC